MNLDPALLRFLPVLAVVIGGAGAIFLAITPLLLRRKPELWREIGARILSWALIAALLVGSLAIGRTAWIILSGLLVLLVFREYARAVGLWADRDLLAVGYLFVIAVHFVAWWPYEDFFPGPGWYGLFVVMPVWGIVALMTVPVIRGRPEQMLQKLALMIVGMIYFAFFLAHYSYAVNLSHGGVGVVLWLGFLVATNDVSAYLFGKTLGRHKLRPGLSPGKTWEGFLGSAVTVTLVGYGLHWLVPFLALWQVLTLAALTSIAAVVGDLTTSVIKRDLGIKDWSQALPGHGGYLDRANSLVYAAPIVFHLIVYWHGL